MKKKGHLQFKSFEDSGEYHGFALNTGGKPVANVGISDDPDTGPYVSWAMANKEGRNRLGPHTLLALMKEHHGIDNLTADSALTEEGARMARSATRRGLIQPHPLNPRNESTIEGSLASARPALLDARLKLAHDDSMQEAHVIGARVEHFNTGSINDARKMIFPKRVRDA